MWRINVLLPSGSGVNIALIAQWCQLAGRFFVMRISICSAMGHCVAEAQHALLRSVERSGRGGAAEAPTQHQHQVVPMNYRLCDVVLCCVCACRPVMFFRILCRAHNGFLLLARRAPPLARIVAASGMTLVRLWPLHAEPGGAALALALANYQSCTFDAHTVVV